MATMDAVERVVGDNQRWRVGDAETGIGVVRFGKIRLGLFAASIPELVAPRVGGTSDGTNGGANAFACERAGDATSGEASGTANGTSDSSDARADSAADVGASGDSPGGA